MSSWVRITDAQRALGGLIREEIKQATGSNNIVSIKEQRRLPQFLREVAELMRRRAPPKSRLKADALVDEAMRRALEKWSKLGAPARGKDSRCLSQHEIHNLSADDRALGTLTFKAYERVARPEDRPSPALVTAVKRDFEKRAFGTALGTNMSLPGVRATVHESVLESYDFYYRHVEACGLGQVKVWQTAAIFRSAVQWVTVVEAHTDLGPGHLELFDHQGRPLASGESHRGNFARWDNGFGDGRETLLSN